MGFTSHRARDRHGEGQVRRRRDRVLGQELLVEKVKGGRKLEGEGVVLRV
jgi:hypothetical protein